MRAYKCDPRRGLAGKRQHAEAARVRDRGSLQGEVDHGGLCGLREASGRGQQGEYKPRAAWPDRNVISTLSSLASFLSASV